MVTGRPHCYHGMIGAFVWLNWINKWKKNGVGRTNLEEFVSPLTLPNIKGLEIQPYSKCQIQLILPCYTLYLNLTLDFLLWESPNMNDGHHMCFYFFMGVCTRGKLGFSILTVYKSKPPENNPAWITYPLPPYTLLFHLQYITCVELHVGLLWTYHGMDMILNVSSLRWPGSAVWTILIGQWSWLWDDRDRFSDQTS